MKTRYILSCLLLGGALSVSAQKMAVKSNLLSAANGALNAGVEYAFSPRWSVKAEYMYYDFGSSSYEVDGGLDVDVDQRFHTGTAIPPISL